MKKVVVLLLSIFVSFFIFPEKFQFKFTPGIKQKIEATINGKQYQNKMLLLEYSQYYKTIRTIKEVKENKAIIEDSNYFYNQNLFTINKVVLEIRDNTLVTYEKDKNGSIKVFDNAFFPTFRNIPVFPDKDINIGDVWSANGIEVQDLFADKRVSIFPLTVTYKFLGYEILNGVKVAKIVYSHSFDITNSSSYKIDPRIKRVIGISETILYFDNDRGTQIREEYKRDYSFLLTTQTGDVVVTFLDSGVREWEKIELLDRDKIVKDIEKKIKDENLEDTTVARDEKGIKIQLENLHFEADTAVLLPEEKVRLDKIAKILKEYKERGVMVIGHTALAGTEKGRAKLSVERAKVIVDYLIEKDAINLLKSSFGGKGSEEPIADNSTEEGKKKNRRAEIYILEE